MNKSKEHTIARKCFIFLISIMTLLLLLNTSTNYTFAGTNKPAQQVEQRKPVEEVNNNKKAPVPKNIEKPQPYPSQQSSSEIRKQRVITVLWIVVAILAVAVIALLIIRKMKNRK